ncbi:ABC transporter substrate-binding protein [Actimicrobium sp. CCI2.3]|uniref:ABC transporter substrate-binding protein n=1 Tax=Actimicrobium sp. CCI2.3 TaxID=3048616 RepID=UPI002AB48D41|nr:ABC transporter substrate-binding protein [Actimicrobium sp. CCI2.3]MDY7574699.1 ABC transporter substrate-binding protein [Actimicrobium sp. CCI2.3]MEB0020340.1 ABC transporter substrate-binding protein [Actimicrobium sp. CCI2.3]
MISKLILRSTLSLLAFLVINSVHAEQGVTDTEIKIGMSTPLTGPVGAYGKEMRDAINNHFNLVNADGGIYGRKLKLVTLDDGYETERTVENTKKLIHDEKVFGLVGYYGSSPTTAAMQVFSAAKIPLVGSVSGAGSLRDPVNPYMFNVRASYKDETRAIVDLLVTMGLKRIGVFYQNDGFGKSGLDGVTEALKKYNLAPEVVGSVERNSMEVGPAIAKMAQTRPQAVIMVTLYKTTAEFVRKMKKAELNPVYMSLSPISADLLEAELGEDARGIGISQVMPYPWNSILPVNKEIKRAAELNNKLFKASYYGSEGYLNAKILVYALKKAGKNLTVEKFVGALNEMHNVDMGGFFVNYSPANHNSSNFIELTVIGLKGQILR